MKLEGGAARSELVQRWFFFREFLAAFWILSEIPPEKDD